LRLRDSEGAAQRRQRRPPRLLEDWFCVYQKRTSAMRQKNRVVTEFLARMDVGEFGDAISGPRR